MQAILGILFHFIGGFASGSFYMPYKKVKGWSWESFWIVGGLFSWLIVPPLAAYLTIPGFMDIITSSSSSTLGSTYLMGLLLSQRGKRYYRRFIWQFMGPNGNGWLAALYSRNYYLRHCR